MFCWCPFGSAAFRILRNGNNSRQRNVQIPLIFLQWWKPRLIQSFFWILVLSCPSEVCLYFGQVSDTMIWRVIDSLFSRRQTRGRTTVGGKHPRAQGSSVVLSSVNVLRYLNTFFGLHYTGHFHLYWLSIRHWGRNARVILKQLRLESLLISCHFAYWISWGFGYVNVLRNKNPPRSV